MVKGGGMYRIPLGSIGLLLDSHVFELLNKMTAGRFGEPGMKPNDPCWNTKSL